LVWILQGDQKVGMNITGRPQSWYKYYRVIENLVWILQGDQKADMYIKGLSKSWYEYYMATKKLVWIIKGDQKWIKSEELNTSHKNMPLGVACCMFLCDLSLAPHF
jgi:hypothetical protein